jgi:hypothetical protein
VAEFIRANRPPSADAAQVNTALDILEAPWPHRESVMLRDWFLDVRSSGSDKARELVAKIRETGLTPFRQPDLLPPIEQSDIQLICWLGVAASSR